MSQVLVRERGISSAPYNLLRGRVAGTVAEPYEAAYEELVTPWNLAIEMRPAAVVAARSAEDVRATVAFANEHGLRVGVQATGHGAVSSLAGDILVVTRGLDEVTVYAEQRWARVGAGVKWLRLIEAAAPHGLAPLNGSSSDVGIVGYITGGGVGPMTRTFGLAVDRVRAFDVVTGDGVLRRVTPDQHPDLFFALRGGKGAGGIVTAVEFDLLPISTFYGGAVYFDGADIPAVIDRWRSWSQTLPELATTSFAILNLPDAPGFPPPLAGRMSIAVRFMWLGDEAEGARLLDEMRAVGPVILDDAAVKPYAAVDSVHADPVDPMPATDPAMLLTDFPDEAVARFLERVGPGSGSPQIMVEIRQLGGAYAREGRHPSAFVHRDARFSLLAVGIAVDPRVLPHAHALFAALGDWDTGGIWPNFGAPHDDATARRAYDTATLERLAAVAERYDPEAVLAANAFARR
ncbi:MAG TPA: FAD-binding oxidoreductase [Jatrophihabitans sp.]|nr:FAD-binding oxidoreductase [Jatrophihabitans sp.]